MDRESFLARKPATSEVTFDDGASVKVRKLTQAEVETVTRKYSTEGKALDGYRYIVSRCVVDEAGKRMFSDDDAAKFADVPFDAINAIALEVMRFSGLRVDPKNA